jgi:hypothetical protein
LSQDHPIKEIVTSLQNRPKWFDARPDLKVDDVVLLVDQANPAIQERMAG